jgi:uncharacterized protein YqjF (DUF2071 family)
MRQTWRQLTFLHWPYTPEVVRPLLPAGLQLDTFAGAAWVGLIPFEIHNLAGLPHFPETNVRTYVVGPDGGRGVWFFSLDAARLLAVIGARVGYHLPYYWASMRVVSEDRSIRYSSRRRRPHRPASARIVIQPGAPYAPSELGERDHFLTARFCLYTLMRGRMRRAQIEHPPWPLARANVVDLNQTLIEATGLPSDLPVKIGYPRLC